MAIMAAIQLCATAQVPTNLDMIASYVKDAAKQEAKLIVLPENTAMMGLRDDDKCKVSEYFGDGPIQTCFSQLARQYGVWIVGGTIPIKTEDDAKVAAASLVLNPQGLCVARYDKIHLFDVAVSPDEQYSESESVFAGRQSV